MLQKWFRQARCEIYLTWKAICWCLRSAGSGLPFRLWLAGFYQWYLCHQQLLVSRAHLCMRCLAVFASTVLPGNRSVYWQIMWSATLCLLQGERCRLCQCCPWLVLNGSRSVARGQPQIFSRPSLCLGRTAVILTLLMREQHCHSAVSESKVQHSRPLVPLRHTKTGPGRWVPLLAPC